MHIIKMDNHFAQAKVTARKQIAIPKKVQERMDGLAEGHYVLFFEKGGEIYIGKGALTTARR